MRRAKQVPSTPPAGLRVGVREAGVVCGLATVAALGVAVAVVACLGRGKQAVTVAAPRPVPVRVEALAPSVAVLIPSEIVSSPRIVTEVAVGPRVVEVTAEVAVAEPEPAPVAEPVPAPVAKAEIPAEAPKAGPGQPVRPAGARVPGTNGLQKRIDKRSEADLLRDLATFPETSLAKPGEPRDKSLAKIAAAASKLPKTVGSLTAVKGRPDLAGLPFRFGSEAVLPADKANELDAMAKAVRAASLGRNPPQREQTDRPGVSPTDWVLGTIGSEKPVWKDEVAVACVQQMFQAGNMDARLQAEQALARVDSSETTAALARWATFDPSDRVRAAAVVALADRDRDEVRQQLLKWVRYPWPRAVEHACEALVELGLTDAVPELAAALDEPDPDANFVATLPTGGTGGYRRVLTRVSHVRNCLLCHPPAANSKATLAGTDPDEGLMRSLVDPNFEQYYEAAGSRSVTASASYLKQDFSATLPGQQHARARRYDYFVAVRPVQDTIAPVRDGVNPYKAAIRFALKELAGEKHATDAAWLKSQKKLAPPSTVAERNKADVARAVGLLSDPETFANLQAESPGGKWVGLALSPSGLAERFEIKPDDGNPDKIVSYQKVQSVKVALVALLEPSLDRLDAASKFRAERLIELARDATQSGTPLSKLVMMPEQPQPSGRKKR